MKSFIAFVLFVFTSTGLFAQANADSLAYQQQRKKINTMLAKRNEKFGQYSESLNMHSGVFGMQTKQDIRNSNDILMDIVKTDDTIYRQLKILLDYNVYRQMKVKKHADETDASIKGYINTITKLRQQVDSLKADSGVHLPGRESTNDIFIIASILLAATVVVLLVSKRKRRQ